MDEMLAGQDADAVLSRFDRSSSESLIASIASEIARLDQACHKLQARLVAMETLQLLMDRIAVADQQVAAAELPRAVVIDASYSLSGAGGFYEIEYDTEGKPFRWTGPDRPFSFVFLVNRLHGARFSMEFSRIYAHAPVESIQCLVDGEPTAVVVAQKADGFALSGELPPRSGNGGSVLTFISPVTVSPAEVETTFDRRTLGVAFQWLSVTAKAEAPPLAVRPAKKEAAPVVEAAPEPAPVAAVPAPVAVASEPAVVAAAPAPVAVASAPPIEVAVPGPPASAARKPRGVAAHTRR